MADLAQKYQNKLKDFKKYVSQSREYFQENIDRFNHFRRFVFKSSLRDSDIQVLQDLGKPTIEFNILEAYVNMLLGEFAKNQPSVIARAADGVPSSLLTRQFVETIDVIEAHLRNIFCDAITDDLSYNIYSDLVSGGFSVARVFTDYINEMSFEQNINVERVFDPTLCGFDPLARDSHKGDGKYCFELFPMTKEDFEKKYGSRLTSTMKFTREIEGFSWSYKNEKEDVVLVCDFYIKENKDGKILKLSNGHTVSKDDYDKFLKEVEENWEEYGIEKPPVPIHERKTTFEVIHRYRLCETEVLEHTETNFKHLPLVFFDGHSINITENDTTQQMTRPYVYHAEGIQRLKNFAGQSLANELENTVQSKWIAAIEAIPTDYLESYTDIQKTDVILYNHFLDKKSPEVVLPPPREVARTPIPPQISDTFRMSDEMTQVILGSYDRAMGMKNAPLSGIAIARGALQGNTASMPYNIGYTKGLNRVAQIIVDLIPKYYRTPRSLPILKLDGKRDYVNINQKGFLYMNYDPNSLDVRVSVGVNFAMQKEVALQTIERLMQASPLFAQFMNQEGLPILLDNIDIRGVDGLKEKAEEFMKNIAQSQQITQQLQQKAQQNQQALSDLAVQQAVKKVKSPTVEEVNIEKLRQDGVMNVGELRIKERDSETKFIEALSKIRSNQVDNELRKAEIDAENTRSAIDAAISIEKHIKEES